MPGAALVSRLGYGRSISMRCSTMIAGCLFIPVATSARSYELVLVALFVIASGITVLQVAANPLVAALGPPERSHFRLTFSQAFNSWYCHRSLPRVRFDVAWRVVLGVGGAAADTAQ